MKYYSLICDRAVDLGLQEEYVTGYSYLPRVHYPSCGHELWWDGDCVPLELKDVPELERCVSNACIPRVISPEEWNVLEGVIITEFRNRGLSCPWIYPGLRLGRAQIHATDFGWDFAQIGTGRLFSGELVEALVNAGITMPLVQEAVIRSDKPVHRKYFELVSTRCVGFAEDASVRLERCSECGLVKRLEYDRLVPQLAVGDNPDFVRVLPTFSVIVSERVKTIVEEVAGNVLAISSTDIGVGGKSRSLMELISIARYDKQIRERAFGR